MTDESLPCPFCGSDGIETFYNRSGVDHYTCQYCGATAKQWNTRVEPDTLPSWAIEAINTKLQSLHSKVVDPDILNSYEIGGFQSLKWILSLRKPENSE